MENYDLDDTYSEGCAKGIVRCIIVSEKSFVEGNRTVQAWIAGSCGFRVLDAVLEFVHCVIVEPSRNLLRLWYDLLVFFGIPTIFLSSCTAHDNIV